MNFSKAYPIMAFDPGSLCLEGLFFPKWILERVIKAKGRKDLIALPF